MDAGASHGGTRRGPPRSAPGAPLGPAAPQQREPLHSGRYQRSRLRCGAQRMRPQLSPGSQHQFVLFFDGGSRGNPGPGGAGAVVVRVPRNGTASAIVWSASMAFAALTTTNNDAEYAGLLTGLTAAAAHGRTPLEVVGDSQFILNQMRAYRAPHNKRLRASYAPARRHADRLGVTRWVHHPRAYNCMADAAANVAMDTRTSVQLLHPTTHPAHARLADHLDSDLTLWLDTRQSS